MRMQLDDFFLFFTRASINSFNEVTLAVFQHVGEILSVQYRRNRASCPNPKREVSSNYLAANKPFAIFAFFSAIYFRIILKSLLMCVFKSVYFYLSKCLAYSLHLNHFNDYLTLHYYPYNINKSSYFKRKLIFLEKCIS